MKKILILSFSLLMSSSLLAESEDFIWAMSEGENTTPNSIQESEGGYVVTDEDGNTRWLDSIENPTCSFASSLVQDYSDDGFDGEIHSVTYLGNLDLAGCENE